ncbi:MAG TPA: hypothetical protein VHM20_07625, partial [Gammaproteobacteria bacterium]|nr:hypothetical protein [Gammaproteobacteria bacterium]
MKMPVSSLFKFITNNKNKAECSFISESLLLKTPSASEGTSYYLIKTTPKFSCALFAEEGFVLEASHLRIDEYYSKTDAALPFAHYTQRYVHPDGRIKAVRVYFGQLHQHNDIELKNGDITVKEYMPDGTEQVREIDASLKSQMTQDASEAREILNRLLEQKTRQYVTLAKRAAELEETLKELSMHLNPETFVDYKKAAVLFMVAIKQKNHLTDGDWDMRGDLMQTMLNNIQMMHNSSMKQGSSVVTAESPALRDT